MTLASHSKFPNHLVHQIQQQKAKISQNRRQTFKWLVKCIANCSILLTTNTFALDGSKSRQYFINSPQQTKGEIGLQMHARAFLHPLSLYTISLIRILERKCFLFILPWSYFCSKQLGNGSFGCYLPSYRRLLTCCLPQPNINNMWSWNPMTSFFSIYSHLIHLCSSEHSNC